MITRKKLIESDEFWEETVDALLNGLLLYGMSKKQVIKLILKYKNEILKNYEKYRQEN